jgi:hypothetical protein
MFKVDNFVKSKFPLPWWEGMKGRGMDKALKFFYSSPPPQPSPINGEGVFLTFYEIIKFNVQRSMFKVQRSRPLSTLWAFSPNSVRADFKPAPTNY